MFQTQNTDLDLWAAIRNNDELAFNELFKRYWLRLYNTGYRYLKDRERSEEIVHDVFLNLWNRRESLEINAFPSYILTAVRYQIYNHLRAAKSALIYGSDMIDADQHSTTFNTGEYAIEEQDLHQEMNEYLKKLPKRCQEIFFLSRIDNLSNAEIALRLGISKRTVENQLTVALKHLRVCFKHMASFTILF
jgi:RNA polymerase sigma-70 factor (family 1)